MFFLHLVLSVQANLGYRLTLLGLGPEVLERSLPIKHTIHLLLFQKVESHLGPFFKVVLEFKKGVLNLIFLSISLAYNVISCRKVAENTQICKIAKFAI